MSAVNKFASGGYSFLPSVFQYSAGVAASPGYEIQRVRFRQPLPLAEGFDFAEQFIRAAERPMTAFCACELRSPAPFSDQGFRAFNEIYVGRLRTWGLFDGNAKSGGAQQCVPAGQSAFRAELSCLQLYDRSSACVADIRYCRQRRGSGRIRRKLCAARCEGRRIQPRCDP